MRHRAEFERFLQDQLLLVCLLAAALALFLTKASLRKPHDLPNLHLTLMTLYAVGGGLVCLLSAARFLAEGRRFDLFLCSGFFITAAAWGVLGDGPALIGVQARAQDTWARTAGSLIGWALIAAAPYMDEAVENRKRALWKMIGISTLAVAGAWLLSRILAGDLPAIADSTDDHSALITVTLGMLALANLVALIGFVRRFYLRGEDLDRWLALGSTLMLFASLHLEFTPAAGTSYVSQGDFLRLLAYIILLVGVWRAIQSSEFGRAVADERSRVAREIHDGLAQYLFAVSSHIALLESGSATTETLPRLKEAALAAQQEARFAILALSSASGNAPFDAALRRYVDVLTADGALDVDLSVDSAVKLAPDEQIEVFRIVQEGLANARKHAGARRAWVTIERRGDDRLVELRDDGSGFKPGDQAGGGQGLKNMRQRAAAIGGAFSLRSVPGRGTALQVVLRS
jgi:signal transduction histidine kinase